MKLNKLLLAMLLFTGVAGAYETLPDLDFKRQIYARENAVVCESRESLMLAMNAQDRGWKYSPTAGIKPKIKLKSGQKVTAEDLGCKEYPDGWPLTYTGDQLGQVQTIEGFTNKRMIRN